MKPSTHRDTTVTKVDGTHSPRGRMGQKYLATGVGLEMRLWEDEPPGELQPSTERDYEVVGYVLRGKAELHIEGQLIVLAPGDCYVVPRGTRHAYRILETFSTVEATHPPAHLHDRDQPPTKLTS
ncbi:MAG TPA: cupin domain-containing protein [Polyangiaceae bacterium]|jgi:quercetin dioxygenase-like cupin family protein|nr:cupin domain-containing protein [Polyangiaceae bacterium]